VEQILTFSRQSDSERALDAGAHPERDHQMARATLPSTIEIRQSIVVEKDVILANPRRCTRS